MAALATSLQDRRDVLRERGGWFVRRLRGHRKAGYNEKKESRIPCVLHDWIPFSPSCLTFVTMLSL
jgi:hypothetical protein